MSEVIVKVIGNYSYNTSRCLGEGVYGKVFEGTETVSLEKVAIKKIDLATFTNDKYLQKAIFSEIHLLKKFSHPNIVRFKDVLSSTNSLYIITQFCKNGDLKELIKRKRFKEEEAFQIMKQLLSGFSQLVKEKIIHRDLKPANILINEGVFKIADFGFAKYVDNFGSQMLKSCVGSPIYMAPQVLERAYYTTKCDIWSLGVIFYEMTHGYPPWKARDEPELLRVIKNMPITKILKHSPLSAKGIDFLRRTLAFSEQQRISWTELFDAYGPKLERMLQSNENRYGHSYTKEKQKAKIICSSGQNHPQVANNVVIRTNLTPVNGHNPVQNTVRNTSKPTINGITPEKRRWYINDNQPTENKSFHKLQTVKIWRQHNIHYHFYCVQLLSHFNYIQKITSKPEIFGKLLLCLGFLVKNKNTYCLSIVSPHIKTSKQAEELFRQIQAQQEYYDQLYSDIANLLQKNGLFKFLRAELVNNIGHGEVINEQRIEKLQNYMLAVANNNAHLLSQEVRHKAKTLKEITLVEVLDYIMDIMGLGLGELKGLKEMNETNVEEEDLKDFVTKVITKVDKIASHI